MSHLVSYAYTPLPDGFIRILELQAGSRNEPLVCRLSIQRMSDSPYEAISYVWGDPVRETIIICNGKSLRITANLCEALMAFRSESSVRPLWTDAICINQDDITEREAQVRLMGSIYTSAQRVLGWLGPDPGTAELAIKLVRKFNHQPEICIESASELRNVDVMEDSSAKSSFELEAWEAVKVLFELPFFHRVWIIQELGLARQARLLYGSHWVDWPEIAGFAFAMDNKAAFLVNHFQLKSWIVNHSYLIWSKSSSGQPRYSFLEVLNWARVHRSTEPLDRIYAFLGHPSGSVGGSLIVEPNYSISVTQAYTELAVKIILQSKNLRTLSAVDHETEPMNSAFPSWVPAWHVDSRCAMLLTPTPAAPTSDDFISIRQIADKTILRTRGFVIDTVSTYSEVLNHNELRALNFENEMQKAIPFLLDHLWARLTTPEPLAYPLEHSLDAFSLTLVSGYHNGQPVAQRMEQHRNDFAAYLYSFEKIRPTDGIAQGSGMLASLPLTIRRDVESRAAKGSAAQFVQDMTWVCMPRRAFRTVSGHIGLGPRILKNGDRCCVLLGSALPMILRRRVDGHSNKYVLLGEANLHGFMNCEAMTLWRLGMLQMQTYLITWKEISRGGSRLNTD